MARAAGFEGHATSTPRACESLRLFGLLRVPRPRRAREPRPANGRRRPSLPQIELGGTIFHAETFGDPTDPLIIVLHGGPGADYRSLLPLAALADDGFHVVFWDQRGAGLSKRHDAGHYSFARYLEDLRLIVEHYTVRPDQPVVFIGHSWGAMYAAWFFDEYGDYAGRVRGAILSEPGGFSQRDLDGYFERSFGSLRFFGEQVNDAAWMDAFISPREHALYDYQGMTQTQGGTPAEHLDPNNPAPEWRFGAVVQATLLDLGERRQFDWTENLGEFQPPVLFLRGELNEAMPLKHQQRLASNFPQASVVTIEDVGHEMVWERPEAYLAETRAFLASLDLDEVSA